MVEVVDMASSQPLMDGLDLDIDSDSDLDLDLELSYEPRGSSKALGV